LFNLVVLPGEIEPWRHHFETIELIRVPEFSAYVSCLRMCTAITIDEHLSNAVIDKIDDYAQLAMWTVPPSMGPMVRRHRLWNSMCAQLTVWIARRRGRLDAGDTSADDWCDTVALMSDYHTQSILGIPRSVDDLRKYALNAPMPVMHGPHATLLDVAALRRATETRWFHAGLVTAFTSAQNAPSRQVWSDLALAIACLECFPSVPLHLSVRELARRVARQCDPEAATDAHMRHAIGREVRDSFVVDGLSHRTAEAVVGMILDYEREEASPYIPMDRHKCGRVYDTASFSAEVTLNANEHDRGPDMDAVKSHCVLTESWLRLAMRQCGGLQHIQSAASKLLSWQVGGHVQARTVMAWMIGNAVCELAPEQNVCAASVISGRPVSPLIYMLLRSVYIARDDTVRCLWTDAAQRLAERVDPRMPATEYMATMNATCLSGQARVALAAFVPHSDTVAAKPPVYWIDDKKRRNKGREEVPLAVSAPTGGDVAPTTAEVVCVPESKRSRTVIAAPTKPPRSRSKRTRNVAIGAAVTAAAASTAVGAAGESKAMTSTQDDDSEDVRLPRSDAVHMSVGRKRREPPPPTDPDREKRHEANKRRCRERKAVAAREATRGGLPHVDREVIELA
jgi:hypothetical protein